MRMPSDGMVSGSFRDPSGFLFRRDNVLYRQVNAVYREDYDRLMSSGLYDALVNEGLLLPHEEADPALAFGDGAHKIIRPQYVPFISYPYEWCFSQLQDAALATIRIQKLALEHDMVLKDSSAYNLQFVDGKPVFIDTLSFEIYREGEPWVAYRQFCQHFLAPLALMHYTDIRLGQLFPVYIDAIPLDLASRLLPLRTRLRFSLLSHIHWHASSQRRHADDAARARVAKIGRFRLEAIIDGLEGAVRRLHWRPVGTEWGEYYAATNYTDDALEAKKKLVAAFLDHAASESVWDLGANTGLFSRIASSREMPVVAFDIDEAAVERNYLEMRKNGESHLLPLVLDLSNPSPGLGWNNDERLPLAERGPADTVLALALIHHLAISNNVPLGKVAAYLNRLCRSLIIEFVPKHDSQVERLLATRKDIFPSYTKEGFERAFAECFDIRRAAPVEGSERTLYLMEAKESDG